MNTATRLIASLLIASAATDALAQSADWQSVIWREPQVRYLLADMTLGGNVKLYRDYPTTERDPDSREAIRLWDAGVRVVIYREKPADKRPVWVVRPDGTDEHVIECLRFQCAIDGSRASWKPLTR